MLFEGSAEGMAWGPYGERPHNEPSGHQVLDDTIPHPRSYFVCSRHRGCNTHGRPEAWAWGHPYGCIRPWNRRHSPARVDFGGDPLQQDLHVFATNWIELGDLAALVRGLLYMLHLVYLDHEFRLGIVAGRTVDRGNQKNRRDYRPRLFRSIVVICGETFSKFLVVLLPRPRLRADVKFG